MDTARRYHAIEPLALAVMARLRTETEKLGLSVVLPEPAEAAYRLEKDPASGAYSLLGEWRNARGHKQGSLVFHADGTFYVEHDIAQPHPVKKKWFVEVVHAWGKDNEIRAEARLLLMPE